MPHTATHCLTLCAPVLLPSAPPSPHRPSRYYNDLWELDVAELKWRSLGPPPGATSGTSWPSPRSGFQLALHGDTLFVYGGYSKVSARLVSGSRACPHTQFCWVHVLGRAEGGMGSRVAQCSNPIISVSLHTFQH